MEHPFLAAVLPPHEGCPGVQGLSDPFRRTHSPQGESIHVLPRLPGDEVLRSRLTNLPRAASQSSCSTHFI